MRRVGAIDCGTNSIRLLIADVAADASALTPVTRQMQIVRLGEGIDVTGRITDEAMQRTLAAAEGYAALCRREGCEQVRFVATSASRDAANAEDFVAGVRGAFADFDVHPEVISGAEEAQLSFAGATGRLRADDAEPPFLVVDIGGGSTEFVRGTTEVEASASVDIGCVRMHERHLHDDPPTEDQVWAALSDIVRAIEEVAQTVDLSDIGTVVGLAGSVTTVTAHALALGSYDPTKIHGAELAVEEVIAACTDLLLMPQSRLRELPFMHPGRIDVIGAGALIWRTVVQRVAHDSGLTQVRASETDILDGIALSLAD
ncbi:MAG: Ppx/GppA phosphatase family protein [Ornithinimicrobium sp.]|uniref:Ppx/GppA phosphatase family protein n=1 Tax=Ornithinimicrobium sp. TaxID=1977084 RepID=UPI0026DFBF57|nr:Ppx/GppA phosphatase family protein [Ornithinimicrobium sp.]MDO5740954.1 Ppx/GppA phosphatase family protein [Ornithinimicrobium sp.]